MVQQLFCLKSLLVKLPWLSTQPKINNTKKMEQAFDEITRNNNELCSFTAHEVWMYCTFFGLNRLHLTSVCALWMVFLMQPHLVSNFIYMSMQVNIPLLRHCDEDMLRRALLLSTRSAAVWPSTTRKHLFLIKVGHRSTSSWSSPVQHTLLPLVKLP